MFHTIHIDQQTCPTGITSYGSYDFGPYDVLCMFDPVSVFSTLRKDVLKIYVSGQRCIGQSADRDTSI